MAALPEPAEASADEAQQAIATEFAFFGDWTERYQYLIDLGRKLPPFAEAWRTDAHKVQVLFVTVDPERDTPAVLQQYVPSFHPDFLGLRGDAEATARVAKEFKVFYQKQPLKDGGYSVDHSAGTYLFDREGQLRLFASYGKGGAALLHDIRMLLAS